MAITFPGTGGLVNCGSDASIDNIWAGGGCVMGWIFLSSFGEGGFGTPFSKNLTATPTGGWSFATEGDLSNNYLSFGHDTTGANGFWSTPIDTLVAGNIYHIVICYNKDSTANNPTFYIDGVLQTTNEDGTPTGTLVSDAIRDFTIGNATSQNVSFDGDIEDVRMYNRILSADEIATIFATKSRDNITDGLVGRWLLNERPPGVESFIDSTETTVVDLTAITVTVPTHVDGDLLVAVITPCGDTGGTAAVVTTPAGWLLENSGNTDLPATLSTPSIYIFTKAASSEPSDYTFSIDQTSDIVGAMLSYRDVVTSADISSTITTGVSGSPTSPSITPTVPSLVIRFMCMDDDELPVTASDFYPDLVDGRIAAAEELGVGTNGVTLGIADNDLGIGAVGTVTWNPVASEEFGGLTLSFAGGFSVKDYSNSDNQAFTFGLPTSVPDVAMVRRRRV